MQKMINLRPFRSFGDVAIVYVKLKTCLSIFCQFHEIVFLWRKKFTKHCTKCMKSVKNNYIFLPQILMRYKNFKKEKKSYRKVVDHPFFVNY